MPTNVTPNQLYRTVNGGAVLAIADPLWPLAREELNPSASCDVPPRMMKCCNFRVKMAC